MQNDNPAKAVDRLFTVAETREMLCVGNTKFYALVKSGHIKLVKLGRRTTRVRGSNIATLIAGGV